MANVPTPHIKAKMGEIAEKILMPGDPLRAKFIAENYLSDAVCVNDTRNMLGFQPCACHFTPHFITNDKSTHAEYIGVIDNFCPSGLINAFA